MKLYNENRIVQTKNNRVPKLKRYLDEMPGIILQDVWDDIRSEQIVGRTELTYPTQKPIKLLERIIEMSTNPKELVLDPLCGSGTTLIAAKNLGRTFIGIDKNKDACIIARKRLRNSIKTRVKYGRVPHDNRVLAPALRNYRFEGQNSMHFIASGNYYGLHQTPYF